MTASDFPRPHFPREPGARVEPGLRAGLALATPGAEREQPARRSGSTATTRLDFLDATRAFALLLGVGFHASLSFAPFFLGWAVQDVSTGAVVADFMLVSHSFRMALFFLLAGFFSHELYHRQGAGAFLRSRAIRLGAPFVAGWFLLRPLLVSGWIMGAASLRGDYDFRAGLRAGFESLRTLPAGLFTGSHLWFLYYLLLATGLLLGLRLAAATATRALAGPAGPDRFRARVDAGAGWLARSGWGWTLLVPPTAVALWHMRFWGMDTPDQSLRPHLPLLAVFGGFFTLGWLFARQADAIQAFGRLSAGRGLLLAASVAATLKLSVIQGDPGHPHFAAAHLGFVVAYATMMWLLVALTPGVFRKFCSRPNPVIRYLADASYWVYLVHLPVVVWLQVAVAELSGPWPLKLAGVSAATLAFALLTYDLFVRATWLGQILNGRRRPRVLWPRSAAT